MTISELVKLEVDRLESLGHPNAIAADLMEKGCRGRRMSCKACPLADRMMQLGVKEPDVDSFGISWPDGGPTIPIGGNCKEFIALFDMKNFPELIQ